MSERKKKSCKKRNAWKGIYSELVKIKVKILISTLLMILWTVFCIVSKQQLYGLKNLHFSMADGYVLMDKIVVKGEVLIPISIYLFSVLIEKESIQMILRGRTRVLVYYGECIKIFLLSAYLGLIETLSVEIVCRFICAEQSNWNQKGSIFWFETGSIFSRGEVDYFLVIGSFFVATIGGYFFWGMLFNTLRILLGNLMLTYGICIIFIVLRIGLRDWFYLGGIQYTQWISFDIATVLIPAIFTAILIYVGTGAIKRKDFYEK